MYFLKYFGVPQIKYNWCWESWSRPLGPKTMSMMGFRVSPTWNPKGTSPKWSRIILRSFWATLLYSRSGSQNGQAPNSSCIFWISYRKSFFWYLYEWVGAGLLLMVSEVFGIVRESQNSTEIYLGIGEACLVFPSIWALEGATLSVFFACLR